MSLDPVLDHMGQWWAVALWIILFVVFLAFLPFYQKSQRKPASVYIAFVVALALEMFGVPLSMYAITWVFGKQMPDGILWGHTLVQYIGHTGTWIAAVLYLTGAALIVLGWREIYRKYWSKRPGEGKLVESGIYSLIRHPQYTGFLAITLGMLCEWATLPLLIMYPILVWLYVRLARREEADMRAEFGPAYDEYRQRTGMFLPRLRIARRPRAAAVR
ncbi:MAG TPA: isoprenylcysteine carboxylmethyltransferase family protein [Anaerolineaceae bacterium]|nr:isoprenylcysteine carboxylmethyltransferase family protein [Anaerolineaceae bacterium]